MAYPACNHIDEPWAVFTGFCIWQVAFKSKCFRRVHLSRRGAAFCGEHKQVFNFTTYTGNFLLIEVLVINSCFVCACVVFHTHPG